MNTKNRNASLSRLFGMRDYQLFKYAIDLLLWESAAWLAFYARLEGNVLRFSNIVGIYVLIFLPLKAAVIILFGLHRQSWHKIGIRDLNVLIRAISITVLLCMIIGFLLTPIVHIPRSIPFLDGGIALLMLGAIRLIVRTLYEQSLRSELSSDQKNVLVIGAGEVGTLLVHEMIRRPDAGLHPIGYLDDDLGKSRQRFYGVTVLGTVDDLPEIAAGVTIDEVLIAMPSATGQVIRHVINLARQSNLKYRIMPGVYEILSEKVSVSQIREVSLEDLLRREPVRLDLKSIAGYLDGQVVLVTGAAGSIGSEIARQITNFNPSRIVLLDREENNLYMFVHAIKEYRPDIEYCMVVANVQKREKIELVFEKYHPTVVFHAAAYKHVSVMEANPDEAVLNNIGGSKTLLDVSLAHNVKCFVNISTDKAVRPASIMGATKRIAEYLTLQASQKARKDQSFVSVRFGNVLGSRGSVVPIFQEQIRKGGPIFITHPDMKRYFMSIPEAAQLVLQAGGMGGRDVIYILDMGEPVRIEDLALDMIRLSGLEPHVEIELKYTVPLPGEKMFEELSSPTENFERTEHVKIFAAREHILDQHLDQQIETLMQAAQECDEKAMYSMFHAMIPDYAGNQ